MPVYFIGDGIGNIKIGYSYDPMRRMQDLQVSNPGPLYFLRVIDGGPATEAWLHRKFKEHWIKGEWFVYTDEMLTIVPPDEIPNRKASENLHLFEPKHTAQERVDAHKQFLEEAVNLGLLKDSDQ